MPTRSATSPSLRRMLPPSQPRFSQGKASSLVTSKVKNSERGSWKTVPTAAASPDRVISATGRPSTSTPPVRRASWKAGTSPLTQRRTVDLPQPEGPVSSTTRPSGTSRLRSSRALTRAPSSR